MDAAVLEDLQRGYRHQQEGALESAANLYEQVLARDPDNEFALNLMAVVCLRRDQFVNARQWLDHALRVNGSDAETYNNLGLAHRGLQAWEPAQRAFEKSLELRPGHPVVLNNLGNVLAALDRHADAIRCFETALRQDPNYADCLGNLCVSLMAERQHQSALVAAERALAIAPASALFHDRKGQVLLELHRDADATECFRAALALDPDLCDARIHLSTALKQLRQAEEARNELNTVLQRNPDHFEAHKCMGVFLEQIGNLDGAARHFREAIRCAPNNASAYYQLAKLSDHRLTGDERSRVGQLLADEATPARMRGPLLFALACELEKDGDFPGSLQRFVEANKARSSASYDAAGDNAYFEAVRATFPTPSTDAAPEFSPIFVLGMPRSGTTLTEQILASHSRIRGAGESGLLTELAHEAAALIRRPFPQCCALLSAAHLQHLRKRYRAGIEALAGTCDRVVDKTPANFQLIGFIVQLFPAARIVYCKRQALDNCLSIFRLPFDEAHSYSHDLESLGRYYLNHERLMAFWQSAYPGKILTVQYEDTVANLEQQARSLLGFLGLSFEPQVLEFHRQERLVLTPSAQQVRRPIYRTSVDAWRRYGDGLRPLMSALGMAP